LLLGLVKEGTGVAASILRKLDIDLRKVRLEVMKIVQPAPDAITLSVLPQTPRTKKAIEYAIEEARANNVDHVGTRHLLLGLLREGEGVAAQVFINLGLRLDDVRAVVIEQPESEMVMTEIEEGLPPNSLEPSSDALPVVEMRNIRAPEPTAREVFFAWEKLRLAYNAILTIVVLGRIGSVALDFVPHLLEAAIMANICFCVGPVAEGYLCWLTLHRRAARYILFLFGLPLALFYTMHIVHRIINHLPLFPGFPNGL
jgi:hypothetical protein